MQEFYDPWDTQALYQDKVQGCDTCTDKCAVPERGIVCGPILRLVGVDYERNLYRGSLLLVCRDIAAPQVSFVAGPSDSGIGAGAAGSSASASASQSHSYFPRVLFFEEQGLQFYRYTIEFEMQDYEQLIKYAIDTEIKPHYRFFVPAKTANFNTISYSCNGFSLSVDTTKFKGSMWFDILNKHAKTHYHVMLGGGDQIYSDGVKIFCDKFNDWLTEKNPSVKARAKLTPELRADLDKFYLKEYIEWYGYGYWKGSTPKSKTTQACFPIAMASIPSINIWDDHDIIDGFGSYSHSFMKNEVFSGVGKAAYKYYMLFQHHVSIHEREAYLEDPSWLLGHKESDYIGERSHSVFTRIGPTWGMLGLDCRTERKIKQIVSWDTYALVFKRLEEEVAKGKMDHLMVMLGVPIAYPRLVWLEWLFSSKFLAPLKYLSKKGLIARSLVNEFNGDVELLDDLNDHWCARHHKKERNFLVSKLQDFGAKHGVRITILSGDVHLTTIGRFRSKLHSHHITSSKDSEVERVLDEPENDVRLMFNVISSAVVNTPPPTAMSGLLQKRSGIHHFDRETDEDVVPLFKKDVDGTNRKFFSFMNRRNWSDLLPVQNVLQNEYLRNLYQVSEGDKCVPGIVSDSGLEKRTSDNSPEEKQDVLYPVTSQGFIATIHAEKDALSVESKSVGYAVVVPELKRTNISLSHKGIKHLDATNPSEV